LTLKTRRRGPENPSYNARLPFFVGFGKFFCKKIKPEIDGNQKGESGNIFEDDERPYKAQYDTDQKKRQEY
jgi:hypothetical protein